MRLSRDVRKTVVFLGHPSLGTNPDGSDGLIAEGTGFLVSHEDISYLVTARHVAVNLIDQMAVRINTIEGPAIDICPPEVPVDWTFHPDPLVDVAAIPISLDYKMLDVQLLNSNMIPSKEQLEGVEIAELGDLCYIVGLFRLLIGNKRILPVVHTGHLARLAGEEPIPLKDPNVAGGRQMVDGYLVEAQTLSGLSGSPVFVRKSLYFRTRAKLGEGGMSLDEFRTVLNSDQEWTDLTMASYQADVSIFGLWRAAWDAPAGEILALDRGGKITVPVGMGVVVPGYRILETLNMPRLKAFRQKILNKYVEQTATSPQSASSENASFTVGENQPAGDDNPRPREDFTSLLHEGAKTKPQGD